VQAARLGQLGAAVRAVPPVSVAQQPAQDVAGLAGARERAQLRARREAVDEQRGVGEDVAGVPGGVGGGEELAVVRLGRREGEVAGGDVDVA
jgi:hypothetical protein